MILPLETQSLYSETLERARIAEMTRNFGHLTGGFGQKTVSGGDRHWYFRTYEGGRGLREYYVGPNNEATLALIENYQRQKKDGIAIKEQLARLGAMLAHGGCMTTDPSSARIVAALGAGGVFRLGGVLVGTHAYVALGNLLGVRWQSSFHTQDPGVAALRTLEVAVPQEAPVDLPGTLESLNMGFLPVPGFDPRSPSTSFHVRGKELRVDLLTTTSRTGPFAPVLIPRFKTAALPMPYMDYLLEEVTPALVIAANSATLIKAPDPAHYGFHKILVASGRPLVEQGKVVKDIAQSSEMVGALLDMRPMDVENAYERLVARGLAKKTLTAARRLMAKDSQVLQFLEEQG